jgi:hypothetical protein
MDEELKKAVDSHFATFAELKFEEKLRALYQLMSSDREQDLQDFFAQNVAFLMESQAGQHYLAIAQLKLGDQLVADFALFSSVNGPFVTLVELERPTDLLFTKAGDPSSRLNHALRQVNEWRRWISNNSDYMRLKFGSEERHHCDFSRPMVRSLIIIGRRERMTPRDSKLLQQMNSNYDNLIVTYDTMFEAAQKLHRVKDDAWVQARAYTHGEFAQLVNRHGFTPVMKRHVEAWYVEHHGKDGPTIYLDWLRGKDC